MYVLNHISPKKWLNLAEEYSIKSLKAKRIRIYFFIEANDLSQEFHSNICFPLNRDFEKKTLLISLN